MWTKKKAQRTLCDAGEESAPVVRISRRIGALGKPGKRGIKGKEKTTTKKTKRLIRPSAKCRKKRHTNGRGNDHGKVHIVRGLQSDNAGRAVRRIDCWPVGEV